MGLEEKKRKKVKRYAIRVELRRNVEQSSGENITRVEIKWVRPKMKRKETIPRGCVAENYVPERSVEGDSLLKRCDGRSRV
jgi:hypothetical protein